MCQSKVGVRKVAVNVWLVCLTIIGFAFEPNKIMVAEMPRVFC